MSQHACTPEHYYSSARRPKLTYQFSQLIVISGYPSSGKTYRAQQLLSFFQTKIDNATDGQLGRRLKCHLINDQSLGLDRHVYQNARAEKDARATEYSAVKRVLARDDIVIADGLNYIKGFRYQLHCEAKALQTPSCVVSYATVLACSAMY